jgi:putative endonuclease
MASCKNGTLYIGVTSNLLDRVYKHKKGIYDGFTKKYKVNKLVYYEVFGDINEAILREKQLKKWKREWKIKLIEKNNPEWKDLYKDLFKE